MIDKSMDKPNFQVILYLILIVVVGLGAGVFSWTYLGAIQVQPQTVQVSGRQPRVLGAYAEKLVPTEEPLAGLYEPDSQIQSSIVETMTQGEVNGLFQENCRRSADMEELDQ